MNSKNKNFEDSFDKFISAFDLKEILSAFNQLCDLVDLNPSENSSSFYTKLQYKLRGYWKAQALFNHLDKKVVQKEYRKQSACSNIKALVIGCGPCGLRCAIELALLGARVVVIDKRETFSRNNVLHLWPFVIHDLKTLGAKIFFGMFCAGSIDHISIRRLQCILFKVALLFGVQFFGGVTFESLILPSKTNSFNVTAAGDTYNSSKKENFGWRAKFFPLDHIISNYEFNAIVGADGKTNILGFPRKELRCRLAIAITANFLNKNTFEEAQVEEISGVAFIFNQQFFKDIRNKTGIDLENIVYYKDETHYFVMTAKKQSLISKGVIKEDYEDPELLLHGDNINYDSLQNYAREAANFVTNYKIPNLEFSKNHRNEPDVAVFDFTHMFAAENASKIVEINGYTLVQMLVGDSLLEPFWPTGSGCALGFLSSLDAAWLVRRIGMINNALDQDKISNYEQKLLILEAIAERESVYQRLSQTTPGNMPPNFFTYTLNPRTRYVQCKTNFIEIPQILSLYDTDDKSKRLISFINENKNNTKFDVKNKQNQLSTPNSAKRMGLNLSLNSSLKDSPVTTDDLNDTFIKAEYMLRWFQIRLDRYFKLKLFKVDDLYKSWMSGVAFLCLIHLYNPDLVDLASINDVDKIKNLEKVFKLFEKEFQIPNMFNVDSFDKLNAVEIFIYLEKIYEKLRVLNPNRLSDEIYEHRSADHRKFKKHWIPKNSNEKIFKPTIYDTNLSKPMRQNKFICNDIEKGIIEMRKEEILRFYNPKTKEPLINKKSNSFPVDLVGHVYPMANNKLKESKLKGNDKNLIKVFEKHRMVGQNCHFCKFRIFKKKYEIFDNYVFHKQCFRCQYCNTDLNNQQFKLLKHNTSEEKFLCLRHFEKLSNISFIREKNVSNTLRDLELKEDKKLHKLITSDSSIINSKLSSERLSKIKKPKYKLHDFGKVVPPNEELLLPVFEILQKIENLPANDIDGYVKKNFLNLRRINNESDEDYNGSLDESTNRLLSLDVVEPLEENQYSWCFTFSKEDLEYSLKKCQVIRKNRLIYKKYKFKEESTSDESEINMLIHDICKTSDEDLFDKSHKMQTTNLTRSNSHSKEYLQKQENFSGISDTTSLTLTQSMDNEILKESLSECKPDRNIIDSIITEKNKIDNSRNLRQMAKLKFCTEPPKPVSINSKEFISQINRNKLIQINTPYYLEIAEYLPPVTDVFVTISSLTILETQCLIHKKSILSASVTSIYNHDSRPLYESCNEIMQSTSRNATKKENIQDQSINLGKNLSKNIFGEVNDIKDIDSLSVNTEDSSVTHTEFTENDFLKHIVPSNIRENFNSNIFGDAYLENKFCSNSSLNSIPTSFHSSIKSEISASSESDDNCCLKHNYEIYPIIQNKNFNAAKSLKFSKKNFHISKLSKDDNYFSTTYFKDTSTKRTFNAVTPPHDIEMDDNQIKCLELNSQFSFVTEDLIPLKNIENISQFQRINNLNKQLVNIEDRLNDLEYKNVDQRDISGNHINSESAYNMLDTPIKNQQCHEVLINNNEKSLNK